MLRINVSMLRNELLCVTKGGPIIYRISSVSVPLGISGLPRGSIVVIPSGLLVISPGKWTG